MAEFWLGGKHAAERGLTADWRTDRLHGYPEGGRVHLPESESVFLNFLRSPGIDPQPGSVRQPYL